MSWFRWLVDAITYPLRALLWTPSRLLAGSRRFWGISLPARMAILVAIFLLICVVTTLVAFYRTQDRSFVNAKLTPAFVIVIAVLVIVIPVVSYKALQLWLEGDVSPFPDIDFAWNAGLAALKERGLDLAQTPLFLVLGSAGQQQEKSLFDAAKLSLNFREVPQGPAALHWYGNAEGIYLVCSDASCLSKLSELARQVAEKEQAQPVPVSPRPAGDAIRGTIVAGPPAAARESLTTSAPLPKVASQSGAAAQPTIRGTMLIGSQGTPGGAEEGEFAAVAEKRVIKLEPHEVAEQDRRLQYLCHLVRRARQPFCPTNGILTLLPFGLIQRSPPEAIEVQRALTKDIATVLRMLKLCCPVTALVVGLEEESGFRELVRRVGRERASGQRFGRGFSVGNPPTPERLQALCAHACGSFEDWVYVLFREKGALSKPGNAKLYALLCKIRRTVQSRLANILVGGYGRGPEQESQAEYPLFSGCYFAAAAETEDRQAFVKGIFDKLLEQQEELEWTDDAYREDRTLHQFAQLGLALDMLLLLALAGMVVHRWFPFW